MAILKLTLITRYLPFALGASLAAAAGAADANQPVDADAMQEIVVTGIEQRLDVRSDDETTAIYSRRTVGRLARGRAG